MILGIHKSIEPKFIIKLKKDNLGNACCCYIQNVMFPIPSSVNH
jgi:hypothetical protein